MGRGASAGLPLARGLQVDAEIARENGAGTRSGRADNLTWWRLHTKIFSWHGNGQVSCIFRAPEASGICFSGGHRYKEGRRGYMISKKATPFILLIDGGSGSGKSSFKNALLKDPNFEFSYVKRYTTRPKRSDDVINNDYIFVDQDSFNKMSQDGQLIEYRHYLFGMSYGLGKNLIREAANRSNMILALMNLGSIAFVRKNLPSAHCVLINAPSDQIEHRLRSRNFHSEDQIAERVSNARQVSKLKDEYDFVCENEDGHFSAVYETLRDYILKELANAQIVDLVQRS